MRICLVSESAGRATTPPPPLFVIVSKKGTTEWKGFAQIYIFANVGASWRLEKLDDIFSKQEIF